MLLDPWGFTRNIYDFIFSFSATRKNKQTNKQKSWMVNAYQFFFLCTLCLFFSFFPFFSIQSYGNVSRRWLRSHNRMKTAGSRARARGGDSDSDYIESEEEEEKVRGTYTRM